MVELRRTFVRALLTRDPEHSVRTKTDFTAWDLVLDRMIRLDGRRPEDVATLIEWAVMDPFWNAVIQSPKKLREKWDQLVAYRRRNHPPFSRPQPEPVSIDRQIADNPHDRRVLDAAGELVDPGPGEHGPGLGDLFRARLKRTKQRAAAGAA